MFGGDGEDWIDPKSVEIIWPGYDDHYDDYGYVTIDDFDPIPEIPEQSYGSFWYHSAVLLDGNDLIMSCGCGGGYPSMKKCFGLDLRTGTWKPMAPMNFARNNLELVKVGHGIMAIGGNAPGEALIEVFNEDFNFWTPMPQWTGPFHVLSGHCAVSLNDHQIMVIGHSGISVIFDIVTGNWKNTKPIPNPRTGQHACLLATIKGIKGILVTGGTEGRIDPNDIYPASIADFYQIENDSWASIANTSLAVQDHQMVLYDGMKPAIIGGEYELYLPEEMDRIHMRNNVQTYQESNDRWFCCVPQMNYKRSKFTAVLVPTN